MFPNRKIHIPKIISPKIKIKEHKIKNQNRTIMPDVYFQQGKKHPGIIVFAPLAKEGKKDLLVVNLLRGLARIGFTVMAPWWPERKMGEILTSDVDDLKKCVNWFETNKHVKKDSIGLIAVSYGTGPAIRSFADEKMCQKIKYLVLVSGFVNLYSTIKYIITSIFKYKKIKGDVEVDAYAKYALFYNVKKWTRSIADKKIFEQFAKESLIGKYKKIRFSYYFNKLSKNGKLLLNWALSNQNNYEINYKKLPLKARKFISYFNVDKYISKFKKPILLLHSTHDRLVPYTEAFKIYDKMKKNKKNTFVLIDAFDHTMPVPASLKNLFKIYIPNFFRLTKFVYRMISLQ